MQKFFVFVISFFTVFSFAACAAEQGTVLESGNDLSSTQTQTNGKIKVVTSFYPLYEIARRVGGQYVDVKNLVPPGAEPHDYELSPKDIASVYGSRILFVNGGGLEPWLEKVTPDTANALFKSKSLYVLDASKLFFARGGTFLETVDAGHFYYDPHIWLDPDQYLQEVSDFEQKISGIDPSHRDYYHAQARNFISELKSLDEQYRAGFQNCSTREFVTNHAAFGYLSKRYDLTMIPIAGFSPDAEPSPKVLAGLTDLLKQRNIKYILVETLVSPKIADTLAQEVGAQTLVLNPLEGLSDEDLSDGQNYVSVMQQNLKNLQTAMDCR